MRLIWIFPEDFSMQALIDLLFIRDSNSYEMVAYMNKNEKTIILVEQPQWNVTVIKSHT